MNFIPCGRGRAGGGLRVRLLDTIAPPVPDAQTARHPLAAGRELIFGLRPEHITEPRRGERDDARGFTASLDVVEPMGMETMVYFRVDGTESAPAGVDPASAQTTRPGHAATRGRSTTSSIDPRTDAAS